VPAIGAVQPVLPQANAYADDPPARRSGSHRGQAR
jgi:hypothetical protein